MSSRSASNGGIPTRGLDVPVDAVFIALFAVLAAAHMVTFQRNKRRNHKFLFNGMLFGFGMSRIVANVLRLSWAYNPANIDLALCASIFLNAGILLIYIVNNILGWRLVRSTLPKFGWNPTIRILYRAQMWIVLPLILALIVALVVDLKAFTPFRAHVFSTIAKIAQTYYLVLAISPLLLISLAMIMHDSHTDDAFGEGGFRTQAAILAASTVLAAAEASYRMGTIWQPARPFTDPAWYESKAAFYCFNFMIDALVLLLLLVGRIDLRFYVPDGHKGIGSYSNNVALQHDMIIAGDKEEY